MRIVFINSARQWGGNEKWTIMSAAGLKERGHEVTIICRPGSPVETRAGERGLEVITDRFGADLDPLAVLRLRRRLKELRAQAVVLTKLKEYWLGGLAAKWAGCRPIIARLGLARPLKDSRKYRLIFSQLVDILLTNSNSARDVLLTEPTPVPAEKVRVIYNGIEPPAGELSKDEARKITALPTDRPIVLAAGRLVRDKGFDILLRSLAIVKEAVADVLLVIAGEGDEWGNLERLARDLGLEANLLMPGFAEDIHPYLRSADLFVSSSRVEGMANVLLEAMAAGLPIVATRAPGSAEALGDKLSEWLVQRDDQKALAEKMVLLLNDEERRRELGRRAAERTAQGFRTGAMIDNLERLISA